MKVLQRVLYTRENYPTNNGPYTEQIVLQMSILQIPQFYFLLKSEGSIIQTYLYPILTPIFLKWRLANIKIKGKSKQKIGEPPPDRPKTW